MYFLAHYLFRVDQILDKFYMVMAGTTVCAGVDDNLVIYKLAVNVHKV